MGLKKKIRGVLPSTARSMEENFSDLNRKLESIEGRLAKAEGILNNICRLIEKQELVHSELREMSASSIEWLEGISAKTDALTKSQRYSNAEYLHLSSRSDGAKRILVAGWYGAENLGDELMLKTLLAYFTEEMLLRTTVLLWDYESYSRFELDHRVRTIHYPHSVWDLELLADAYDVIVWGGGAIIDDNQFTDDPSNINTGNIFIRLNELALARKKHVYCLGLSSNQFFADTEYVARLEKVVKKTSLFSVRDAYSAETLERAGISVDAIVKCQDIVFANKDILRLRERRESYESGDFFKLGVVLFFTEGRLDQYIHIVEEICKTLEKLKHPFEIALIPFLNEEGIDVKHYERIRESISSPEFVKIVEYSEKGVLEELASCNFSVCYKYHAALISNLLGVHSLNVCCDEHPHYYNKMKYLADIFQYQSHLVLSEKFEKNVAEVLTNAICDSREPILDKNFVKTCINWMQRVCASIDKS